MRVLGVDPGISGALALLDTGLGDELTVHDMPAVTLSRGARGRQKGREIMEALLWKIARDAAPDFAFVERVHAMPKQGVTSTFNFGVAYGLVRGVLAGCDCQVHLTPPTEWKRWFKLGNDKAQSRLLAARMFPAHAAKFSRVSDDGRAEAALLALYGSEYLARSS